jgi:hypothetical protein
MIHLNPVSPTGKFLNGSDHTLQNCVQEVDSIRVRDRDMMSPCPSTTVTGSAGLVTNQKPVRPISYTTRLVGLCAFSGSVRGLKMVPSNGVV